MPLGYTTLDTASTAPITLTWPPAQLQLPFCRMPALAGSQRPLQHQQVTRQPQHAPRNSPRKGRVRSPQ